MNEQALKERLKHIAKKEKRSFQEIWKLFLLERLLVRLGRSHYSRQLIFKGGLLLSYYIMIGRETSDIDLLARNIPAESTYIQRILNEICEQKINDGILMTVESVEELAHSHMNYPGYRAKIQAYYGVMRDRIQIDIGMGDSVDPVEIVWPLFQYREQALFEDSVSLQVYPVETIFAEKLETVISRGAINSRMKDFHDLFLLCQQASLINPQTLIENINKTFMTRDTKIEIPISLTSDDGYLQNLWNAHLRTLGQAVVQELQLPDNIFSLIEKINAYLSNSD
jgi:predicted nucleotidyltransferase component of viral defense system